MSEPIYELEAGWGDERRVGFTPAPLSALVWTKDKPTVPGFYWTRYGEWAPIIVDVWPKNGALMVRDFQEHRWWPVEHYPAHLWAGPLAPPSASDLDDYRE